MRIEDSFLLEESGLRNLSGALPKTIDDIEALAHPVLRHRLVPTFNAEAEGIRVDDIITRIVKMVPRGESKRVL